jgi:UDP-N-acetylmuramoylalanine--D-glutamate ligase
LAGNQPYKALLKIISKTKNDSCAVLELSSFQLEFYPLGLKAPKIALITNLYIDHLNRYKNLEEYAQIKAKIFQNQTENDYLILNYDNQWTKFFLSQKPKAKVYFFSLKSLAKNKNGFFLHDDNVYFQENSEMTKWFSVKAFKQKWGEHNLYNLLASLLASFLYLRSKKTLLKYLDDRLNTSVAKFQGLINSLPPITLRQESVYSTKNLEIINDSAATTPDAVIQALSRFAPRRQARAESGQTVRVNPSKINVNQRLILITGGTDKNLEFKNLAQEIKARLNPENIIFLNGSATKKLLQKLKKLKFNYLQENIFENLKDCIKKAFVNVSQCSVRVNPRKFRVSPRLILFSPGATSFEKFANEFERGKHFNTLIRKLLK